MTNFVNKHVVCEMSEMIAIVAGLEQKVHQLLDRNHQLTEEVADLNAQRSYLQAALEAYQRQQSQLEHQVQALQMARSVLGSDQNTTDAKQKMNTLIKELDRCIGALSV
jgi:phage shock protein A